MVLFWICWVKLNILLKLISLVSFIPFKKKLTTRNFKITDAAHVIFTVGCAAIESI